MSAEPSDTDQDLEELGQQIRKRAEATEKFFPLREYISIGSALGVALEMESCFKVPGYKTEKLLARALRAEGLTTTQQGFAAGKTAQDWAWARPVDEEKLFEREEVTSELAVEELFRRKADRKRQKDRERKRRKAEISKKTQRNPQPKKRKPNSKKRKSNRKNRKRKRK